MERSRIELIEISKILEAELIGSNCIVNGLNLCNKRTRYVSIISYVTSDKFIKAIKQNPNIKALILTRDIYNNIREEIDNLSFLIVDYPEEKFYELHSYLYEASDFYDHYKFDTIIGENCTISDSSVIEKGVIIKDNVIINHKAIIKKGTIIGEGSIIGCGSIIGSEGFQLITDHFGRNNLIKHAGGCEIGKDVYIGENSTVCNSLFENTTEIGNNTKIDNLVHIAHNCIIGANCVLTAGVVLSGSTIIGENVWLAPNSTVSNRVVIENNSFIGIGSVVLRKVKAGTKVFGNPSKEI